MTSCPSMLDLTPAAETVSCGREAGHAGLHVGTSSDHVQRRWLDGVTPGSEGQR